MCSSRNLIQKKHRVEGPRHVEGVLDEAGRANGSVRRSKRGSKAVRMKAGEDLTQRLGDGRDEPGTEAEVVARVGGVKPIFLRQGLVFDLELR